LTVRRASSVIDQDAVVDGSRRFIEVAFYIATQIKVV